MYVCTFVHILIIPSFVTFNNFVPGVRVAPFISILSNKYRITGNITYFNLPWCTYNAINPHVIAILSSMTLLTASSMTSLSLLVPLLV